MAPFDFDLNELPPPEDVANDASPPQDPPLPPARGSSPQHPPAREPSPQDLPPPPVRESSPQDLPPPPVRELSPQDLPPPPVRKPSPKDPPLLPSPVLDLEAPLSPLDEDEDDADQQLPGPPTSLPALPEEPCGSASAGVAPSRASRSASDDTLGATRLPDPPRRRCEVASPREDGEMAWPSSQETSAPRGTSRGPSETSPSSHRSPHGPPYVPRDEAISKRRRGGGYYDDEDAASSYGGSSRGGPPSPPRHEQAGGRLAPAKGDGLLGPRPRNNRRRRRPQRPYGNQNPGQDQRMQGYRGREQGFRGQERPQSGHQSYHGPRGNAVPPNFPMQQSSSSAYRPLSGPPGRDDAYHRRQNQTQGAPKTGGGYRQREAPPFSGPHGREDAYHRRQNQVHEPPKTGGHQHRDDDAPPPFSGTHGRGDSYGRRQSPVQEPRNSGGYRQNREAPAFKPPPPRSHGREDSYGGGRPSPAAQEPGPIASGGYQQREAPRRRGNVPVRPYHPYARDGGAFDGANAGKQARHESRPNYQHRRDDARNKNGGPLRGHHRPYGEVQK